MSFRKLAIATLLSHCPSLLLSSNAATVTLYNAAPVESIIDEVPSQQLPSQTVSAIDVLPGNITEYVVDQAETISGGVGSGTATSFSAVVTSFSYTVEEGASFIGDSVNFVEFTLSESASQTISTPVTGVAGCTVTASNATKTQLQCAQVAVFNGTSTQTLFYNATESPFYTLTESTPPPTVTATSALFFPSGIPTATNGAKRFDVPLAWVVVLIGVYIKLHSIS